MAKKNDNGCIVHEVRSPYQAKTTQVGLLLPTQIEKGKTYPVVYVLPVEAASESRYGDGLREIQKLGLHNTLKVVFVALTFTHLPRYADHPFKPEIRQESYLLKDVVPFVDKLYPVQVNAEGRLLLGFRKSGWGAWSLLLRNPHVFRRADARRGADEPRSLLILSGSPSWWPLGSGNPLSCCPDMIDDVGSDHSCYS